MGTQEEQYAGTRLKRHRCSLEYFTTVKICRIVNAELKFASIAALLLIIIMKWKYDDTVENF